MGWALRTLSDLPPVAAVPFPKNGAKRRMENSKSDDGKFRERMRAALQRRCGPAMPLTYKHVAQATGKQPQTVRAWCELGQRVADEDVDELIRLFGPSFYNEVFMEGTGCILIRIDDLRKAKELQDAVALIERVSNGL